MKSTMGSPCGPWGTVECEALIAQHMEQDARSGIIGLYISSMKKDQVMLNWFANAAEEDPTKFADLDSQPDEEVDGLAVAARGMLIDSKDGLRAELWLAPIIERVGGTRTLYLGKVMLSSGLYLQGSLTSIALSHPVANSGKWMTKASEDQMDILLNQIDELETAQLKPGKLSN
jgi:hypothetical protein